MANQQASFKTTASAASGSSVIFPTRPLGVRLSLWSQLWAYKLFIKVALGAARYFNVDGIGEMKPTYEKVYPKTCGLSNHIWLPKDHKAGMISPLFINIHGGGLAIGDPRLESNWCDYLAKNGICVVSINYRKAPRFQFPVQADDVTDIIQQVIADPDLPVDKSNICMGGFSGGAMLSLSSCQRDQLQGKIKALLLYYPPTDFSRRYMGVYRDDPYGAKDILEQPYEMFDYGAIPSGQDRLDPALSTIYADRSKLPPNMFFIAAEYDMLCQEDSITAKRYARAEGASPPENDSDHWTAGGIRWRKVLGVQHSFNISKRDGEAEVRRKAATDEAYKESLQWLREIYK